MSTAFRTFSSQHYQEAYSSDYGFESIVVAYRQKLLIERLAQSPPRIVVEIGCGSELLYETYTKMGRVGEIEYWLIIEPAEAFVKIAEASALPNLHVIPDYFQSANKRILNLLPREPDLVICSSLLHEVPSSQDLLTAIHAVMGQRSRLHVNLPNSESLHRRLAKSMDLITDTKVMSARNKALSQHRAYDMNSLAEDLAAAGFRVLDKGGYLIKPFTHAQMEYVAPMIGPAVMDGLFELGMELPELASEIWVEASLGEYD